jgi:hypothetical protein
MVFIAATFALTAGCRTGPDDAALRELARYDRPCALGFAKARLDVRMGEIWRGGGEGRLVTIRRMLVFRLRHGGVEVVPNSWTGPAGTVRVEYSERRGSPIRARGRELDFHCTMVTMAMTATDGATGKVAWRGAVEAEVPPPPEDKAPTGFKAFSALEEDLLWRSRALFISRFAASGAFQVAGPEDRTPVRPARSAASSAQSQ